jgi:predicted RNA binding protein YcfA (HicA-like mRNA interferase family)
MTRKERVLQTVLRGDADANIAFSDLCRLLRALGFEERIRGSHHIFAKDGVEEILNVQARGSKCKPYQVKQVRQVIVRYRLVGETDAQTEI